MIDSELYYDPEQSLDPHEIIIHDIEFERFNKTGTIVLRLNKRPDLQVGTIKRLRTQVPHQGRLAKGKVDQVQVTNIAEVSDSQIDVTFEVIE